MKISLKENIGKQVSHLVKTRKTPEVLDQLLIFHLPCKIHFMPWRFLKF
ncbi:hypothetical protein [Thermodesulfobacterium hveragerdense]|nr:hypothetical protein [Thermodesulfobacterium hveragerdense]